MRSNSFRCDHLFCDEFKARVTKLRTCVSLPTSVEQASPAYPVQDPYSVHW